MINSRFKKTRIAPTPSGYLHLGNIYSFLQTVRIAKLTGAFILLRIDDLDRQRTDTSFINDIFETLNFFGISWNEGPKDPDELIAWSQLSRLGLYQQALDKLIDAGALFACSCSRSQLTQSGNGSVKVCGCREKRIPLNSPDVNWRLDTSEQKKILVLNHDGNFTETSLPPAMSDFIVKRKDGLPAYQLSSVVDDMHFGIDLIVRGNDLWDSTLAQLYLSTFPGFESFGRTKFYHHQLLFTNENKKMSKSAGDTSIQFLRKNDYSRNDIENMIEQMVSLKNEPR